MSSFSFAIDASFAENGFFWRIESREQFWGNFAGFLVSPAVALLHQGCQKGACGAPGAGDCAGFI
jgi:hypothetical protein